MAPKRNQVTVFSDKIMFPSCCSKCLSKNNLINYLSEWKTTYIREWPTKVTRKAWVSIPICQSCRKELIRNERIFAAKAFAILAPLTFGIALVSWLIPIVGNFIVSLLESLWLLGTVIGIIWIILAIAVVVMLFVIIRPQIFVNWPVKFEKHNVYDVQLTKRTFSKDSEWTEMHGGATFSCENENYARLFAAVNPGSPLSFTADSASADFIEMQSRNLKKIDSNERRSAAIALGKTKDPKAVEPLIQALKDESWVVRSEAACSLGNIEDVRAVEALTEATQDKSRWVRSSAKTALDEIKRTAEKNQETEKS